MSTTKSIILSYLNTIKCPLQYFWLSLIVSIKSNKNPHTNKQYFNLLRKTCFFFLLPSQLYYVTKKNFSVIFYLNYCWLIRNYSRKRVKSSLLKIITLRSCTYNFLILLELIVDSLVLLLETRSYLLYYPFYYNFCSVHFLSILIFSALYVIRTIYRKNIHTS